MILDNFPFTNIEFTTLKVLTLNIFHICNLRILFLGREALKDNICPDSCFVLVVRKQGWICIWDGSELDLPSCLFGKGDLIIKRFSIHP